MNDVINYLGIVALLVGFTGCASVQTDCSGIKPELSGSDTSVYDVAGGDHRAEEYLYNHPLSDLYCWSDSDNPTAQYLLGYAFENGIGVSADWGKALLYYKRASVSHKSSRTFVYSAPVGKESYGRLIPITTSSKRKIVPESRAAYERLLRAMQDLSISPRDQ